MVIEQFSNTRCGICANRIPPFWNTVQSFGDDVILLSFYASSPYSSCPLYQAAKETNDQRVGWYSIPGTPSVRINGEAAPTNLWQNASSILNSHTGGTSAVELNSTLTKNSTDFAAEVTYNFHGQINASEDPVLHVFVIERSVTAGSLSGYTQHHNVVRARLTEPEGFSLDSHAGSEGGWSHTFEAQPAWDADDLAIVAFVQSQTTAEIHNSSVADAEITSNVDRNSESSRTEFRMFPNPATDKLTVESNQPGRKTVSVINLLGSVVYTRTFTGHSHSIPTEGFARGMYLVRLESAEKQARTTRLVLE